MSWATKYRPKSLDEVIGQDWAKKIIKGALENKSLCRSWLIVGPWGSGKTTVTRILSKSLACLNPMFSGEACLRCSSCLAIDSEQSTNYNEVDSASFGQIEAIRGLIEEAQISPSGNSPFRVIALDEAHVLSKPAQNVLLKTMEEPPPQTHFMLITTDPQKLLPTIASRCVPVELQPVDRLAVVDHLERICKLEGKDYERKALEVIVLQKYGHVRDALTLAETISLAGPLTLDNVKKHLHLDLDEEACNLLAAIGADWEVTFQKIEQLVQDYAPQELWLAIKRVIVQSELHRLAPVQSSNASYLKKIIDRYGGRLSTGSEWALGHGGELNVRTETDLTVALSILHTTLGGTTIAPTTVKKEKPMGTPKHKRGGLGGLMEKTYSPDDFAKNVGFPVKEDPKPKGES